MDNLTLNKIQITDKNGFFTPVLNNDLVKKTYIRVNNPNDTYTSRWEKYKHDLKDKSSKAYKYTLAGCIATFLGGASLILGRGKDLQKFKRVILDNLQDIKQKETAKKTLSALEVVKEKTFTGLNYWFSFDKFKDNMLYRALRGLGAPGKKLSELSKFSSKFPKILTGRQWKKTAKTFENYKPIIQKELETNTKLKGKERKFLEELLKENPFTEVVTKFEGERVKLIKDESESLAKIFNKNYFTKGNILSKEFWSGFKPAAKNIKGKVKNGKDLIMDEWNEGAAIILKEKIQKTGGVENKMEMLEEIAKNSNSNKFKEASDNIHKMYDDSVSMEVDRYAGRVRDLSMGAGISEVLMPIITGAILTDHTLKGKTTEEKADNFVNGGGLSISGGLLGWMGSMMMGLNGPTGLIVGALSGVVSNTVGKVIYKQTKKATKKVEKEINQAEKQINKTLYAEGRK